MRKFLRSLRRKKPIQINESLVTAIEALAEEDQRDLDDLTEEIIALGVAQKQLAVESLNIWDKLTPREKEVVALVCLGYMNKEIGEKLYISPQTVKTHVSNALRKFDVKKRGEIQMLLADWDFRDWDRANQCPDQLEDTFLPYEKGRCECRSRCHSWGRFIWLVPIPFCGWIRLATLLCVTNTRSCMQNKVDYNTGSCTC